MAEDTLAKARTRSVDHLQRLYAFVISLAFAESLRRTFLTAGNNVDLSSANSYKWKMCAALLVTVIPFYHGANRYLDATYVTGERSPKTRFAIMIDFFFLFIQALLLFTVALLITTGDASVMDANHRWFYRGLGALLAIDVLWIFVTRCTTKDDPARPSSKRFHYWATVNIGVFFVIFVLIQFSVWNVLLFVLIGRSVMDYLIAHEFYYPSV